MKPEIKEKAEKLASLSIFGGSKSVDEVFGDRNTMFESQREVLQWLLPAFWSHDNPAMQADLLIRLQMDIRNMLRTLKFVDHPEIRVGYQVSPEGILNAYRECDISFDGAARELRECISPPQHARDTAIAALEKALKSLRK